VNFNPDISNLHDRYKSTESEKNLMKDVQVILYFNVRHKKHVIKDVQVIL
jgi:hypothetical protein